MTQIFLYSLQQDYQTYIQRRAQKRQSLIVSLGDQNRVELEGIQQQKLELVKGYEERKAGLVDITCFQLHGQSLCIFIELKTTLMEKENELVRITEELKTLDPYRVSQRSWE